MMQPVYINQIASIHAEAGVCKEEASVCKEEIATQKSELPYLSACEPDYKSIITNATLRRRMSRIIKMGVACGLECIESIPSEEVNAIITATGLGCLADTEKFLNSIIENKEQLLNPTPFIQSTFNTIGAQIALIRQIHAYNMTYVHRGLSFESALLDGIMKIWEGNKNVLVGAIDEITPNSHAIQQRLGLLKDIQAGEGAQFFLLGHQQTISTFAELIGVTTFLHATSSEEVTGQIHRFLQQHQLTPAQIDWFITGKNGNPKEDALYIELESNLFPSARWSTFKDECGEYPTASSYAVWKVAKTFSEDTASETENTSSETEVTALETATPEKVALIYNHYHFANHSLILIRQK